MNQVVATHLLRMAFLTEMRCSPTKVMSSTTTEPALVHDVLRPMGIASLLCEAIWANALLLDRILLLASSHSSKVGALAFKAGVELIEVGITLG